MSYIVKMCGKKKVTYDNVTMTYLDNGIVIYDKTEEVFIPYGAIEYIIRKVK